MTHWTNTMKFVARSDDLQAGDVLVYERATVLVTSVYRRPGGDGVTYTLGGTRTFSSWPPEELPSSDVGELLSVRRVGSQLTLRVAKGQG